MKGHTKCIVLGSLFLTSAVTVAAPMSFSMADYSGAQVSSRGELVGALNATSTPMAITVNSVVFEAVGAESGKIKLTGPSAINEVITLFSGADTLTSKVGAGDPTKLSCEGVYSTINNGQISIDGLRTGEAYELQMVFSDTRGNIEGEAAIGQTSINLWDMATDSGAASFNTGDIGGRGKIVTGSFVADKSGVQNIYVSQTTEFGAGPYDGYIAAIQLRILPKKITPAISVVEDRSPSAIIGVGGITLILKSRD